MTSYFDRSADASSAGPISDLRAELLDRSRHFIADAHDVAHAQSGRDRDVHHLDPRLRRLDDVAAMDVRVLDHLVAGRRVTSGPAVTSAPSRRSRRPWPRRRRQGELHRRLLVLAPKVTGPDAGAAPAGGRLQAPRR